MIITTAAEAAINAITEPEVAAYREYLATIAPRTHEDLFRRWLFAYSSVHTTWEINCKLYAALAPLNWIGDYDHLLAEITLSGAGLQFNRANYISEFTELFWAHPDWFWKNDIESWGQYRNRLMHNVTGIGQAKSSFAVELTYPVHADVVCTDTHIMQMYGKTKSDISHGKVSLIDERAMETHWIDTCRARNIPPVAARWIAWDKKQGKTNSRYWANVLEVEHAPVIQTDKIGGLIFNANRL